jgi:CRISPR-associated endonuclease/helicase Cas3
LVGVGIPPEEFEGYFEALNGVRPFPWQRRLASQLLGGADWPSTIALPTATGKTAVLDIAVFCLAAQAEEEAKRTTGRRIFYVVDRRVIVDEAYERARRIADKLLDAQQKDGGGILSKVAKRLMKYGGESPLEAVRLRGAMYRDEGWADSPVQPLICVSTVDQVGSRLLFRGYGLSAGARPIHAALVANDSLVILDEAHISAPFSETAQAVERYRSEAWAESPLTLPFKLVRMSATLGSGFSLTDEDMEDPVLRKRLDAHKTAQLHRVPDGRFEEEVTKLAAGHGGETVAVILNTVSAARGVFKRLSEQNVEAVLLTGRSRPYDRDSLMRQIGPRIEAGRRRAEGGRGLTVVATQCVEVGADFDFDAIVTECASLDALVQRFGRVDRLGEKGTSRGDIVIRRTQASKPDWLYGEALKNTWAWLLEKGGQFDFRPAGLGKINPELVMEQKHAPVMLPAYLDSWVQTSPPPELEPGVAPFLHGQESDAEVQLVWRADLDPERPHLWLDTVSALPPSTGEAMPVPVWAVRSWLGSQAQATEPVSDLESSSAQAGPAASSARVVLRWGGPERSEVAGLADVRPGDTLVLPAAYGGADRFGWDPDSREPVRDVAEFVSFERGYPVLRLHRSVMKGWFSDAGPFESFARLVGELSSEPDEESVRGLLEILRDGKGVVAEAVSEIASSLLKGGRKIRFSQHPSGDGFIVEGRRRPGWDEADSPFLPRPVPLSVHSEGVRAKAHEFAAAAGLPGALLRDITLAALLHDAGKADRRFQVMLHGDEIAAMTAKEPLAKSGTDPLDRKAIERARRLSGYPKGARHEGTSVSMIKDSGARGQAADFDLVLHLVASHHGHSRPFFPVVEDRSPPSQVHLTLGEFRLSGSTDHGLWRLDSGASDRFWTLTRRYGYYGLAFLEAVLRLADHRRSAEEEREEEAD